MADHYDYIICGAGAAGLSLALRLCKSDFTHLRILIIDKEEKTGNSHTWCFWDREESVFDSITSNQFSRINFFSSTLEKNFDIAPYKYKMVQASRFYSMIRKELNQASHIDWITDRVEDISEVEGKVRVTTPTQSFTAQEVFTSIFKGRIDKSEHLYVAQHFRGWFIKTSEPVFQVNTATFMDFRIDQEGDCRFFYVLPTSENEALVEIAIFSNEVMKPEEYDPSIKAYITEYLDDIKYEIQELEYGVIPMTEYPFWNHNTSQIHHIGTAGGAVKPSSGFAFKRIQEHSDLIAEAIRNNTPIKDTYKVFKNRFHLYDSILLDVILKQKYPGAEIFTYMFKNNSTSQIFSFLDGKTSLLEEMNIFRTFPFYPFTRGLVRQKIGF